MEAGQHPRASSLSFAYPVQAPPRSNIPWALQNYDAAVDIPALAEDIQSWFFRDKETVFLAFRAACVFVPLALLPDPLTDFVMLPSVSELPHKLPHHAALLAQLSLKPVAPVVPLASRISSDVAKSAPPTPNRPLAPGLPARPVDVEEDKPAAAEEDAAAAAGADGDAQKAQEGESQEENGPEKVNVGKEVVQDLAKAFQQFLDERKWKSVRYCVSRHPFLHPCQSWS